MQSEFDVIVVGVGAMGASACHHLARRGVRVLGIEQFDIPHNLGSSHGLSRMIRLAYYEHPDYVALLLRAYELWHELEAIAGATVLHLTGGLYMGRQGCELVHGSHVSAKQHGLTHELLDAKQIQSRFPQFDVPDDFIGLFEPRAGFLEPEKAISAFVQSAVLAGAQIHAREIVQQWSEDSGGVRVQTDRAHYRAQQIVFCAGAWTSKLVSDLGVPLTITRQPMLWFTPSAPMDFAMGKFPVWAIDRPGGGIFYGFPTPPGEAGLKAACHFPGSVTDPDRVPRELLESDVQEVDAALRRYLPAAAGPLLAHRVCIYTNSPDHHFIIDRHPQHQRVTLACGFSGHGFKFASVVGEILADLAMNGRTQLPADFLRLKRFR
ncbi:MAG TPA: N-methyl-L-tryptophan oxidase [Bryobacteraceae bacterium]|nr:N-methyl-L-tryptophan oxidase [Bryobacteraceae bacterium]